MCACRKARGSRLSDIQSVARPFTNAPPASERMYDTSPGVPKILGLTGTVPTDSGATVDGLSVVLNWFEDLKQKVK